MFIIHSWYSVLPLLCTPPLPHFQSRFFLCCFLPCITEQKKLIAWQAAGSKQWSSSSKPPPFPFIPPRLKVFWVMLLTPKVSLPITHTQNYAKPNFILYTLIPSITHPRSRQLWKTAARSTWGCWMQTKTHNTRAYWVVHHPDPEVLRSIILPQLLCIWAYAHAPVLEYKGQFEIYCSKLPFGFL